MTPVSGLLIRRFEEQFTPHGLGYLYRENRVGAAIWVSVQERAALVATFVRGAERLWWQTIAVFVAALLAVIAATVVAGLDPAEGAFLLLLSVTTAGVMLLYVRLLGRCYRSPARVLAGRTPDAPALDRAEALRLGARSQPWTVFLVGPLSLAWLWVLLGPRRDLLAGWHLAWVVGTAAYLAAMAVFAWRKWRLVRTDPAQR